MIDLWKAEEGEQIRYMLAPKITPGTGTRLGYNFNNIFSIKGTIEFRQMESTLDPVRFQNWAIVCYKLVLFARDCNVQKFRLLLLCLLKDIEQYGIWDLLEDLKCQVSVVEWFKQRRRHAIS